MSESAILAAIHAKIAECEARLVGVTGSVIEYINSGKAPKFGPDHTPPPGSPFTVDNDGKPLNPYLVPT